MQPFQELVAHLVEAHGSDLYLKSGSPPAIRVHGEVVLLDLPQLTPEDTQEAAKELLSPARLETLRTRGDAETAITYPGMGRYRINVYRQRGVVGVVARRVITVVPQLDDLGLPPVVAELASELRGIVLVTGPSGVGKTTTIAAMIGHINRTRPWHIITLEDPIEVVHSDAMCLIDQRGVGTDIPSYAAGLRHAVRQDPDVIFIGEIRDEQTAEAAMLAAETGHMVISTMHTVDATETVNRIIDLFPAPRQFQARRTLAGTLRGVVSQRLVRRGDGSGRVPAVEVLVVNGRIAELIVEPGKTDAIAQIITEGASYGMQSFDQALVALVAEGIVSLDDAQSAATNRHDFMLALAQGGYRVPALHAN